MCIRRVHSRAAMDVNVGCNVIKMAILFLSFAVFS